MSYQRTPVRQRGRGRTITLARQIRIEQFFRAHPNSSFSAEQIQAALFAGDIAKQQVRFCLNGMGAVLDRARVSSCYLYSLKKDLCKNSNKN